MEMVESAEQFSLQENRPFCIQLDYLRIATPLIPAEVITQQEIAEIQAQFVDNTERMQELISRLVKLNSEASFEAFQEAVKQLGEVVLAQKLLRDQSSFGIPLRAEYAHPCLFTPTVLDKIFSYLAHPDLSTARLVCHMWNSIIAGGHINKFTAKFLAHSGHKQMIDFASTGLRSIFCKNLNRFVFDIPTIPKGAWVFYKMFFVEFGPKTQSLELCRNLDNDLLQLIFSAEIKQSLKNLKQLKLFVVPDKGLISDNSLNCLSHLETLAFTHNARSGERQHENCMHFLEKFLENGHKLKAMQLNLNLTEGFRNANVLPNLFKGSTLESLKISYECGLGDAAVRLMTVPNTEGRLKDFECVLEIVSPKVFWDFIASHRQTLQRLSLMVKCPNSLEFLEMLPRLESLKYFRFYALGRMARLLPEDTFTRLDFCTQAPNLKYLNVHILAKQGLPQPTFVHDGLEEMMLDFLYKSIPDGIREFITHIPHCFPNLTKLEVSRLTGQFAWPNQLGQLHLQAGSSEYSAKWERTDNAGLHRG